MFARLAAIAQVFLLAAVVVSATYVPEKRQISADLNDVTSDLGSAFGDLTSVAGSFLSEATSAAGSAFTGFTSNADSVFSHATSLAGSLASDATSVAASVATLVRSADGHAETVISQAVGEAFTLASSGAAGVRTTVAGVVYTALVASGSGSTAANGPTVTTPNSSGTSSAAVGSLPPMTPVITSLATVLSGIFLGAWVVL
ncbi:hypothetical protein BDY19DRAFT_902007 [Irpex rosettiformis]|uniref:Uncharacterized protein n=1 Tax=Irpex rosettiformis TaxID=378272 RepID=A0ACB8UKM4_9APHY|nr:hypothetical protein BDY19DRAFT_902007 [Irpex rosettiformis]